MAGSLHSPSAVHPCGGIRAERAVVVQYATLRTSRCAYTARGQSHLKFNVCESELNELREEGPIFATYLPALAHHLFPSIRLFGRYSSLSLARIQSRGSAKSGAPPSFREGPLGNPRPTLAGEPCETVLIAAPTRGDGTFLS